MEARRQAGRVAVGVVLAGCLAGCTSLGDYVRNGFKVGPNYCRPPAPVAADWIDKDEAISRDPADLWDWWTVFNDPKLDELNAIAYQQNLTVREAGFRVLQARAILRIRQGEVFPQQQDSFGGYSRNAVSVATANSFGFFGIDRFFDQWDLGFNLAWELDVWGRFRRAVEAAEDDLDASVENYDDVLVTLLADIATNYVQYRTTQQQLAYVRTNVGLQTETLKIANARFQGGLTTQLDVSQSESTLAQTQSLVPQLEIQIRQTQNALCVLLGIPPEDLYLHLAAHVVHVPLFGTVGIPGPIPTAPMQVAAGIPADLLSRRPDVRQAEREAAAQSARIGVAVSELYPHIGITGLIGWSAEELDDLLTSRALQGTIGPSFQWNILNYGRLANNIRLQDARFQELVVRYQNTVLQAGAEVENGLVAFVKSQQQASYLATSVKAAQEAERVAVAQYKGGLVDFNRLAVIQQNLVDQQNQYAQAQGDIAQGLIQVYRALGGGWQIRLDGYGQGAHCLPPKPAAPAGERIPAPRPLPEKESRRDQQPPQGKPVSVQSRREVRPKSLPAGAKAAGNDEAPGPLEPQSPYRQRNLEASP